MKHIFKIQLQNSDMFISALDMDKGSTISYSIRDKQTGKLMEPKSVKSAYKISGDELKFDNRFISVSLAHHINQLIN